jgi:hypothetical protein
MEIIVQQRQVLDNEEIFDSESIFESIEDLKDVIEEIIENWSNMQGSDTIISRPKQLKVGSRIVLSCAANDDIETFEIKDVILAGNLGYLD